MVNLSFLNIDFVNVLGIVAELGRVLIAIGWQPPPPEYTFRSLEPLYKLTIENCQERCQQKYQKISMLRSGKDAEESVEDEGVRGKDFDDLAGLLKQHARLIQDLQSLMQHPHLHPRKHDDIDIPELDVQLGPERYIEPPYTGYGFSNDYVRQLLAIIPGPLGRHFEKEEATSVNLTKIVKQIIIAFVGGASLLVPMIIMTFVRGVKWRLIIVSVATILFGTAFAIVSNSKDSVLAGTAAYAAVMVVYIGSASPSAPH